MAVKSKVARGRRSKSSGPSYTEVKSKKDNSALNLLKISLEANNPNKAQNTTPTWVKTPEESARKMRVFDRWALMINFRSTYDAYFQDYIERYEAQPFMEEDGSSGMVVPLGKAIIETAQAQESKNPPSFAYSAGEFEEDEMKAKILETIVTKHVWYQKGVKLDTKLDILNQDKMILGTMYMYVGYRRSFKLKRNFADPFKTEEILDYDDIVTDLLYPQDAWLHPLANYVEESPDCVIRKRFDYQTFLTNYSDKKFYKNLQYVTKGGWNESSTNGGWTRQKDSYSQSDEVVVLEYWNKLTDELVIYANGIEIYYGPNPYADKELPITDFRNRLQHNTYLGESELARIASLNDTINAFINIAVKKEKRAASGINLLDNDFSDFDDTANLFESDNAIRVNDPKSTFVHYEIPGMSASTDKIIQMLLDFLVFTTGIDFRQITDLSSSTKATVAALRREISQQRIQLNVTRNENCGYQRLGWLLAKRVQQYYPLPKVEYIANLEPGTLEKVGGKAMEKGKKGGRKNIPANKISYRPIRLENMDIEEVPGEKGEYTPESLRNKGYKEGAVSFFQARPEYIRTKGDLCVRVIPGSTLAAIQELRKNKAMEYVKTAVEVVKAPDANGVSEPYLSVKYGLEELVKAFGYDLRRAFDTSDKKAETPAQDAGRDVIENMNQVLGGDVQAASNPAAVIAGANPPTTPQRPPAALTGQRSEPVREMANELGVGARATNKPM